MAILASRKKADGIFIAVIIAGLCILLSTDRWWPEIVIPFGLGLALKQYLRNRKYDMNIGLVVFTSLYLTSKFYVNWQVLMPILLTTGSLYLIFREYFIISEKSEAEEEEELNKEFEEDS